MVQDPLGREDVHEAQVQPVHRHRPRHRRERVEPADLPEPPARLPRLLEQRQGKPAGRAQVPSALLRHPVEPGRLRQHVHPANAEELVEIAERDGRIEIRAADRRAHPRVRDPEPIPMLSPQISGLGDRRDRHRRQVGQKLRVLRPHRLDHDRVGGPDEGAPGLLFPQLKVFSRNEFVADHPSGDRAEPRLIAGVDQLFWTGWVEIRHRFGAQDEHPVALRGDGKSPPDLAVYLDRPVGAGRKATATPDTGLVHHLQQQRLVARHRDRIGGAHSHTREARDT